MLLSETSPRWDKWDWAILAALLLLAAALRFYKLGAVPPGFQFDEAFNAIDAEQVLAGNRPLFLPANGGREVLYTYFQAGIGALLGLTPYTLRLASALWGIAAVGATYAMLRTMLRRDGRAVAGFTALALAISYWHLHFSHYGIRVITMPAILSAVFGTYWAATHAQKPGRRVLWFVLAGALAGLSVYANPAGRFVPFVLIAYTAVLLIRHPAERRLHPASALGGLLLAGAAAIVVFLPLGLTFLRHPEFFFGHASEVSVFAARVSGGRSPLALLGENVLHVLGMFSFYGDVEWAHGIAGRPVLDWALSIPFMIGVVIWAARLGGRGRRTDPDTDALALLLIWAVVMLAPSVLSEAAPNYSRTLPSLPAALLPVGLGLAWIALRAWPVGWGKRWIGYALAGGIAAASLAITFNDYFVRYPQMEQTYYVYDADKLDALALLHQRAAQGYQVYLSPLWAEHAPVRFINSGTAVKALDTADTLVLPAPGLGAIYALTGEETARAEEIAALWPGTEPEAIDDKYGRRLLSLVTVAAATAAEWPPGIAPAAPIEARFEDAPTLLGMMPGGDGTVALFWRSDAPTRRSLTTFLHLIDQDGNRVAQADKLPGNGSYETAKWSVGERVIDRLSPEVSDPCTGGETVRALAGWYELAADGARRPRSGAPGDAAVAGTIVLPVRAVEQGTPLPTDDLLHGARVGDAPVTLVGVRLHQRDGLQGGSPLTLDLYLRAEAVVGDLPARLGHFNEFGGETFWEGTLAPNTTFEAGEVFCQRVRAHIPAAFDGTSGPFDWEGAMYDLRLDLSPPGSNTVYTLPVAVVRIGSSTRRMDAPPFATPIGAPFGSAIRLAGATVGAPANGSLPVELVWQAVEQPDYPYTAFVHLLDGNGALVAQSDAIPAGGYPTHHWLPGEYVADRHMPALDPALPPGTYTVAAGLYDSLTLERLGAAQVGTLAIGG